MALVAYSDSEGSGSEPDTTTAPEIQQKKRDSNFQVDRNTGKLRVALPRIKPEPSLGGEDGPRKKLRVGGGLSGFNSFLPAPKRAAEKKAPATTTRKPFGLKTGAGPGFDREADAELKIDSAFDSLAGNTEDTEENPTVESSKPSTTLDTLETMKKQEDVKLQGNPMMFRPLSVGRPQKKRKVTKTAEQPVPASVAPKPDTLSQQATEPVAQAPKPKVSLFSLSSDKPEQQDPIPGPSTKYQPLVYNAQSESEETVDPALAESSYTAPGPATATVSSNPGSSLDSIANDLNLSKSERRQLFGRNAVSSHSQVRTFNTDEEYASNQVLAQGELAAAVHNPVRAIAPGKHTLQQLVSAASSQKEALEESFASGRRNKREAGSKYGW